MPTKIEKDIVTGTPTTGHEWDGIKELNTPLPSWWLYIFYATVVFGAIWSLLYPSFPTLSGYFGGVIGYSQRADLERSLADAQAARAPMVGRIAATDLEGIRGDPALLGFAMAGGRAAFGDNCAPCHGSGAAGSPGYPNLVDDVWIWGGGLHDIRQTIAYGIRNANDQSRLSEMPRFGVDGILTRAQIDEVAEHVLSLTGRQTDAAAAARGASVFADNCAACHGEAGGGMRELGAPPLNGRTWLYGGDKASIVQSVTYSRAGAMPAWEGRLDEATIRMLTVYVHALGGGE
jgi:cytochrome c oxidase cbb3-type subunit 3